MSHVIIKFNLNLAHLAHGHTHSKVPQHHTQFSGRVVSVLVNNTGPLLTWTVLLFPLQQNNGWYFYIYIPLKITYARKASPPLRFDENSMCDCRQEKSISLCSHRNGCDPIVLSSKRNRIANADAILIAFFACIFTQFSVQTMKNR